MSSEQPHCQGVSANPAAVLQTILQELGASGRPYALVQAERTVEEALESDIDIAFGEDPNPVMLPIFRQIEEAMGARLIQCLHYEIPHGYYYVLAVGTPPRFLHLDCLYDPLGVNRYRLPTPLLLEGVVAGSWAKEASKGRMALYLLMKRAVKGHASPLGLDALRNCFSGASDDLWSDVRVWFGDRAQPLVVQLLQEPRTAEGAQSILARLRIAAERQFKLKHPGRYLLSLAMDLARKARRFVQPTGLFVVVLGPDGAGKSTVAGLVISELARAFRGTWRFHWRPGLLPKLGRGKPTNEPLGAPASPPQSSKYRGIVSLARFAYYWIDFVAGYWLRIYPRKAQTTLVIGERYFPDVLVNPARYGFSVPRWLLRLAARCVPSPDLVVLLTDDVEAIHARKPELEPSALVEQLELYRNEIQHWRPAVTIQAAGGAEAVATRISELIMDACARRTARRLERHEQLRWHGFPSAAQARLWVAPNDSLPNALNLYHPYSWLGRSVKASLGVLPPQVSRAWPGTRPNRQTAEELNYLGDLIRRTLGSEKLAVSFWTRTAGLTSRLIAQASSGGSVLSYVKIASSDADSERLRQEVDLIAWMEGKLAGAAALPRALAFRAMGQYRLLFLSAPTRPGKQRPLWPDHDDARFLSALASFSEQKVTAALALEAMSFSASVVRVARIDSSAAGLMRKAMDAVCKAFAQRPIRTSPCHGDYAPWNTLTLSDGRLYVFDWEHASKEMPLFTDLFHRVLMPARLVLRQTPRRIVSRLLALYDDPVMGRVILRFGVQRGELAGYLLLYLIGMAVREEAEHGKVSDFVSAALRHALQTFDYAARRLNVLVAAYACEPGGGSEPGVGWNMSQAISREHDAWVITRRNNRDAIERALAQTPNPNLHFHYADLPPWARFWKKGGRGIRTYYYLWQFAACLEAWRLMRRVRFDLAHHVTFVNSYIFSFLGLLPLPFVWGPLGSDPRLPASLAALSPSLVLMDRVRYLWKQFLRVADPLFWLCAYRARLIVGIDASLGRHLPIALLGKRKFVVHTAIGVDGDLAEAPLGPQSTGNAIRILSVGRMVNFPVKGFRLALSAFAELLRTEPGARLELVGDGPTKRALQEYVSCLGIASSVDFVGWLPRQQALSRFAHADIFLFPSCEGGGMVVLEAMAHGLPVVCLDYGGPGKMVTSDCGFAVEVGDVETMVASLAAALGKLAKDRSLRLRMALAAKRRIEECYSWELRHKVIGHWYARALSNDLVRRDRAT